MFCSSAYRLSKSHQTNGDVPIILFIGLVDMVAGKHEAGLAILLGNRGFAKCCIAVEATTAQGVPGSRVSVSATKNNRCKLLPRLAAVAGCRSDELDQFFNFSFAQSRRAARTHSHSSRLQGVPYFLLPKACDGSNLGVIVFSVEKEGSNTSLVDFLKVLSSHIIVRPPGRGCGLKGSWGHIQLFSSGTPAASLKYYQIPMLARFGRCNMVGLYFLTLDLVQSRVLRPGGLVPHLPMVGHTQC